MNLKKVTVTIEEEMQELNRVISRRLLSNSSLVNELLPSIFNSGKKVRPILATLVAHAIGQHHERISHVFRTSSFLITACLELSEIC